MTARAVTWSRTKWGGVPHYEIATIWLGEDEHGTWLAGWPGEMVRRGDLSLFLTEWSGLQLVPHDDWWAAWFSRDAPLSHYVDICTPATWIGDALTVVDLDLDVIRVAETGAVEIVDQDELEEHAVTYGYPDDVVAKVWETARAIEQRLVAQDEPFGEASARWWSEREATGPRAGR